MTIFESAKNPSGIQTIDLDYLDSIEGIERFTAASSISLQYCTIDNIEAIKHCENLQHLTLNNCRSITDISPVASVPFLRSIDLCNTGVTSIDCLDIGKLEFDIQGATLSFDWKHGSKTVSTFIYRGNVMHNCFYKGCETPEEVVLRLGDTDSKLANLYKEAEKSVAVAVT